MKVTYRLTDEYNGRISFLIVIAAFIHVLPNFLIYHTSDPLTMNQLAKILRAVGYHAALIQPLLPMYSHLIVAALFPIYTGAHASLSRPSTAAKPPKKKNRHDEDEEPEEREQKMEGLSPSDALMLPLLGGLSLTGLYFLIKWLGDPAVLNKVLNWYFSIFGVLSLARLLTDTLTTIHSFIFPATYAFDGKVWTVDGKQKKAKAMSTESTEASASQERDSPLPGSLSNFPFPALEKRMLWTLRDLPSRKIQIRVYIHKLVRGNFKIGPHGITAILLAITAELYFNLVSKPWWLTNLLGSSFAYSALQIMTPTTSWTGTLILGGLFIYDIYFVFFTPLMVTVATQLDIPAKLIFPRPAGPGGKQGMSMLGLGDVVLPGMMIAFALRFDLYIFYLRKQTRKVIDKVADANGSDDQQPQLDTPEGNDVVKPKWLQATGSWGERYWTRGADIETPKSLQGGLFPKTYFHASLIGYVVGMLFTLGVMQVFGHAQPALLYLVPGTLGALWGTALIKGDIKTLWAFTEAEEEEEEEEEEEKKKAAEVKQDGKEEKAKSVWTADYWVGMLLPSRALTKIEESKDSEQKDQETKASNGQPEEMKKPKAKEVDDSQSGKKTTNFSRDRKSELIFFSVNMPRGPSLKPSEVSESSEDKDSSQIKENTNAERKRREINQSSRDFESSDGDDYDQVEERTIQQQTQLQKDALEKSKKADNEAERDNFMREAQKAEKKAKSTKAILDRGDKNDRRRRTVVENEGDLGETY